MLYVALVSPITLREIVEQLDKSFDCLDFSQMVRQDEGCDLYTVGIIFQVFRQFGFKLSAGKNTSNIIYEL